MDNLKYGYGTKTSTPLQGKPPWSVEGNFKPGDFKQCVNNKTLSKQHNYVREE